MRDWFSNSHNASCFLTSPKRLCSTIRVTKLYLNYVWTWSKIEWTKKHDSLIFGSKLIILLFDAGGLELNCSSESLLQSYIIMQDVTCSDLSHKLCNTVLMESGYYLFTWDKPCRYEKLYLFLKLLRSEGVRRGLLGSAFDVCFPENVACMVRHWYLATGRVSESNSAKRLHLKFMVGRVSL